MSLYETQHLIHRLNVEPALVERFQTDPRAVLAEHDLTDAERAALADGDVVALWQMGVHPLLMLHYCRARRIPPPRMYEKIGPLAGQRRLVSAKAR
ncbi:MAG TPA: hypothetical protein VII06_14595 [Chloroflexota bacterium]|jgi:hypothetical protein